MLLRWLIDNYVREAAAGPVREALAGLLPGESPRGAARPASTGPGDAPAETAEPAARPPASSDPRAHPQRQNPSDDDYLPCQAALVFALGIESGGLVDLLQGEETSRQAHGVERAGRLGPHEVVIVESGVGQRAAQRATVEAIRFYRPKWVVSTGFAGALDALLRKGHIVMADEVADLAGERLATGLKLDPQTVAATRGLHVGRLLTVPQIIRRLDDRRRLAAEHGAIACDMETFGVARACRELGTRFIAVRVITDTLDDELPPEIEALLAQKSLAGKLGAAAGAVFRRPSAVKDLWQLREDALKASDRLAKFLTGVVQQLASADAAS